MGYGPQGEVPFKSQAHRAREGSGRHPADWLTPALKLVLCRHSVHAPLENCWQRPRKAVSSVPFRRPGHTVPSESMWLWGQCSVTISLPHLRAAGAGNVFTSIQTSFCTPVTQGPYSGFLLMSTAPWDKSPTKEPWPQRALGELTTLLEGCPIYDTVNVTDAWVEVADPCVNCVDRPWKVKGGSLGALKS